MREIFLLENFLKNQLKWGIYNPFGNLPVGSWKGLICPSGRPANGQIFDRCAYRSTGTGSREQRLSGRSTARSTELIQRAELSASRPGQSTGAISREQSSLAVDRSGRPASPAWLRARPVHVGRPARSTAHCYGRPARSTGSQPVQLNQVLKTWVFIVN